MPGKVYRTAIYCRLSREDGDKVESNSIASQRAICEDYIARHDDLEIVCEPFVDDGYSGVSFNRPNFKKLEDAIRKGAIDCIVVKDLSRFSRNYIDGGRYLEKIFPQLGMHYIRYDVLYAYVLSRLQYWSQQAQQDEDKLLKRLLNASDKERSSAREKQASELKKAEKRKAEVDGLFAKMYEDWAAGRITEYNFNMLSEKYQGEQKELDEKIQQLHEAMEAVAQTAVDAEKWVGLMRQYVNPTELTAELLNTLIEKIFVHEAVKGEDGSREQEVEIFYRFIGKID